MRIVIFGLTVSSSWGNGHATLWRSLIRALDAKGHRVVFYERDVPYYAAHRDLPQLHGGIFLSDGGMETDLIFNEGVDLPHFASVVLLQSMAGRAHLKKYYESYLEIARRNRVGFVLDSATWRASLDWAPQLGLSREKLKAAGVEVGELKAKPADPDDAATNSSDETTAEKSPLPGKVDTMQTVEFGPNGFPK